jgi:hypothetical protein
MEEITNAHKIFLENRKEDVSLENQVFDEA